MTAPNKSAQRLVVLSTPPLEANAAESSAEDTEGEPTARMMARLGQSPAGA